MGIFEREPKLSGPDPDPAPLLGRSGLRHPAAIRPGDGGGDLPSGDGVARAWPGSVEGGLRPAMQAPDRRTLRRKSQSAGSLLPVSSDPEAEPRQPAGFVPGLARRDRNRSAET